MINMISVESSCAYVDEHEKKIRLAALFVLVLSFFS